MKIYNFESFIRENTEESESLKKFGKVFAGAQTTADKSWGLKFNKISGDRLLIKFRVVFPDNFVDNFHLPNQVPSKSDDWKIKLKEEFEKSNIIIGIETVDNRTHFDEGIPKSLRGIGLGYIIYEEFVKFLGYACSKKNSSASMSAQRVWQKLAKDPDFLPINSKEGIFVIYKNYKERETLIEAIISYVKRSIYDNMDQNLLEKIIQSNKSKKDMIKQLAEECDFSIDDEILIKYPEIINPIIDYLKFKADGLGKYLDEQYSILNFKIKQSFSKKNYKDYVNYFEKEIKPKLEEIDNKIIKQFGMDLLNQEKNIRRRNPIKFVGNNTLLCTHPQEYYDEYKGYKKQNEERQKENSFTQKVKKFFTIS